MMTEDARLLAKKELSIEHVLKKCSDKSECVLQNKTRLKQQKDAYITTLSRAHFCISLKENGCVPESADFASKEESEELQLRKSKLEDLTKDVEEALDEHAASRKTALDFIARLEQLQRKDETSLQALMEAGAFDETLPVAGNHAKCEGLLSETQQQLLIHTNLYDKWTTELAALSEEKVRIENEIADLQQKAKYHDLTCRFRSTDILEKTYNAKIKHFTSSLLEIEFLSPKGITEKCEEDSLLLSLAVTRENTGRIKLKLNKLVPDNLDMRSNIEQRLEDDDLAGLLGFLSTSWQKSYRLSREVEELRHKYALDWLPKEMTLKLLLRLEQFGEVVCTVHVNPMYPGSSQPVSHVQINGEGALSEEIPAEITNLTDAVQFITDSLT